MYRLSEILTKFSQVKTYKKLLKSYILHNLVRACHAFNKSNIFKMVELIFQEVWWELQSVSICCITKFSILYNQVNVSDMVNKSSVGFFLLYTKVPSKEEFRISCCWKQESLFDMQKRTDQLNSTWWNFTWASPPSS